MLCTGKASGKESILNNLTRIQQENWQEPECSSWIQRIEDTLSTAKLEEAILIGHSVGCVAILQWFARYRSR